jgi:hypothetical protein
MYLVLSAENNLTRYKQRTLQYIYIMCLTFLMLHNLCR